MRKYGFANIVLISFVFLSGFNSVSAQIVRFGLKAGVDVADHKIKSDMLKVSNRVGFEAGITMETSIPLIGFGIETGLFYGSKDYNVEHKKNIGGISDLSYLMVPVYLKKRFSLLGIAGIYLSGGVFGNLKLEGGDLIMNDSKYKQKDFQAGLGAGAGVSLFNNFDLGLNYRYKLTDTYTDDAAKDFYEVGRQTWTVSLAYLF